MIVLEMELFGTDLFEADLDLTTAELDQVAEETPLQVATLIHEDAFFDCPVRTGALRDSGEVNKIGPGDVRVGFYKDYASYVDGGTSRMEANPFFTNAFDRNERRLDTIMLAKAEEITRRHG